MVCVECWLAPLCLAIIPFLKYIINWIYEKFTGKPLLSNEQSERERILKEAQSASATAAVGENGIDHSKIDWGDSSVTAAASASASSSVESPKPKKPRSKKAD